MGIIGKLFTKTNFGRKYVSDRILKKADVCFVSFPKTGRTWLRVMLIRYLQLYYNLPDKFKTGESIKIGQGIGISERSVKRYLDKLIVDDKVANTAHGEYMKVKK